MKTNRDRFIMMILPGLAIVLFYGMYSARGQHQLIAKLTAELDKARAKKVTGAQLAVQNRKLSEAKEALDKTQSACKDCDENWHRLTGPCLFHDKRSYRQDKLLSLLKEHKVRVIDHARLDGVKDSRTSLKLSEPQQKLAKLMAERAGKQTPLLLRLQVRATYPDLSKALQGLSSGEPLAIPLSLVMKETPAITEWRGVSTRDKGHGLPSVGSPDEEEHEWLLLFWI